jgi:hypothetical protein
MLTASRKPYRLFLRLDKLSKATHDLSESAKLAIQFSALGREVIPVDEQVEALANAGRALNDLAMLISELKNLEQGNWNSADVDLSDATGARVFHAQRIYFTEELRQVLCAHWREKIDEKREELVELGVKVPGALD